MTAVPEFTGYWEDEATYKGTASIVRVALREIGAASLHECCLHPLVFKNMTAAALGTITKESLSEIGRQLSEKCGASVTLHVFVGETRARPVLANGYNLFLQVRNEVVVLRGVQDADGVTQPFYRVGDGVAAASTFSVTCSDPTRETIRRVTKDRATVSSADGGVAVSVTKDLQLVLALVKAALVGCEVTTLPASQDTAGSYPAADVTRADATHGDEPYYA